MEKFEEFYFTILFFSIYFILFKLSCYTLCFENSSPLGDGIQPFGAINGHLM